MRLREALPDRRRQTAHPAIGEWERLPEHRAGRHRNVRPAVSRLGYLERSMGRLKAMHGAAWIVLGLASVLPSGCSSGQATQTEDAVDSLSLAGPINAASVQLLRQKLTDKTKRLVIN